MSIKRPSEINTLVLQFFSLKTPFSNDDECLGFRAIALCHELNFVNVDPRRGNGGCMIVSREGNVREGKSASPFLRCYPPNHNLRGSETIATNICWGIPGCLSSYFSLGKNRHFSIRSVISLVITTCLSNHLQLNIILLDSPPPVSNFSNNLRGWTWAITIKLGENLETLLFLFPCGHGTWRVLLYPMGLQVLGRFCLAVKPEDFLPRFLSHASGVLTPPPCSCPITEMGKIRFAKTHHEPDAAPVVFFSKADLNWQRDSQATRIQFFFFPNLKPSFAFYVGFIRPIRSPGWAPT